MNDSFFANVRPVPVTTSAGAVDLPIVYRDGSAIGMFYRAGIDAAARVLDGTGVEPWPILGRALVLFAAFEYRDDSIGPYNEIGIAILARTPGSTPSLLRYAMDQRPQPAQALWVVNLPVTTAVACAGGREIWGLPKYVAPIETAFTDDGVRVVLKDEFELTTGAIGGPSLPGLPFVTFSRKDGQLLRTVVEVGSRARWGTGRDARFRVFGDGPTATTLRALGIEGARPTAVFRHDRLNAILPAGVAVG